MTNVLTGLQAFAEAWEGIATKLLQGRPPWDFSKAPTGGAAKIVDIEFAAMFVTAANRAVGNNGIFEQASFAKDCAKAELKPHRRTLNSLSAVQRDRLKRRVNQYVSADMDVMIEFGLFEKTEDQNVYRLTKQGEEIYGDLKTTSIDDLLSRSNGKPASQQIGNGSAGRDHHEIGA